MEHIKNRKSFKFTRGTSANNFPFWDKAAEKKEKEIFDIFTEVRGGIGTMLMNRNHNFNIFTEGYLNQLDNALFGMEMTEDEVMLLRFG